MTAPRPQARAASKSPLQRLFPLLLVFYSFLILPPEVQLNALGVNFPSYRLALLLVSAPALWTALRGRARWINPMDLAVALIGFWTLLSFTMVYDFQVGLVRGAGITIDTVLPYFVARACIKSLDDLRYFLILCLPALAFAGGMLALESLTGKLIVRPAFASIFGGISSFSGGEAIGTLAIKDEFRLGLLRAYGPFPHPILAGISMIGFLPLYWFSGLRSWPFYGGLLVTVTGFFGLSSAAFLALILSFSAIAISVVKAYFPRVSWWSISGMLILLVFTLHISSKNGIVSVISRLTLTPATADYRQLIWQFGSETVASHPWFGIGYQQWQRLAWMGESVDAHFLLLAMRHGLVVPIVLLAAILYGVVKLGVMMSSLPIKDKSFCIGINLCAIIFVIVGQTVNYFGSANIIFMAVVGFLASAVSIVNEYSKFQRQQQMRHAYWAQSAAAGLLPRP